MFEVSAKVLTEAPKIYGKTRDDLEDEVESLKKWMDNHEHFPEVMNTNMLRNFVIINKFNMEKAKDHIENYYKLRVKYPDIYVDSNPKHDHMQRNSKILYFTCSPRLTKDFDRIIFYKMADPTAVPHFNATYYISHIYNVFEMRLQEDFMVNTILVLDMKDIPLSILIKYTPMRCYKAVNIMEKVYSFRLKKVYFINMPTYAYFLLAILKKVMKPKLYERLEIHSDELILEKIFPSEYLPSDYGGREKSVKQLFEMQQKCMHKHQARFDRLDEIQEELTKKAKESSEHHKHHCVVA